MNRTIYYEKIAPILRWRGGIKRLVWIGWRERRCGLMVMNGSAQLFRRRGGFANGRERANACKCMSRFRCPMRKGATQNKVLLMKKRRGLCRRAWRRMVGRYLIHLARGAALISKMLKNTYVRRFFFGGTPFFSYLCALYKGSFFLLSSLLAIYGEQWRSFIYNSPSFSILLIL